MAFPEETPFAGRLHARRVQESDATDAGNRHTNYELSYVPQRCRI